MKKSQLSNTNLKKVHFISLGCARNLADTETMVNKLMQDGYEIGPDIDTADYIVVNTCGFLKESRDETIEILEEVFEEKPKNTKVIAAGCMVKLFRKFLEDKFPNQISYFIGPKDINNILKAFTTNDDEFLEKTSSKPIENTFKGLEEAPKTLATPSHYAYLKIAEGCQKACSFCLIPKIKGKLVSKEENQILEEFDKLLKQGVFEIILIAQDLGDYGKDRFEKNALAALLKKMLERSGKFWIRLLYLYPDEITDELIDIMKSDNRIAPYVDMPIQHIDDDVLKLMNRNITSGQIIETISKLRKNIPSIYIRTSLMVGFPTETDEQFEKLCSFVKEIKLDHVGIFKYSREEMTKAYDLVQVEEKIKEQRFEKLAKVQYENVLEKNKSLIGKTFEVIVDGYHPESDLLMTARHVGLCPGVDSNIIINDIQKVRNFGKIHKVKITDVASYDLIGEIVDYTTRD
jgi:ribosomal protein S12 methylthiotransferase